MGDSKTCNKCQIPKLKNEYRGERKTCKSCENKIRYVLKKKQRLVDPSYDKKCKEYDVMRKRKKEKEDPYAMFLQTTRQTIRNGIKKNGYTKKSRSYIILGCPYEEFKKHIESQWESWMNWGNYGLYNGEEKYGWDLDHIIPLSSVSTEEDTIRLNHYTNIQPLCSYINRCVKKDNIEWDLKN